MTEGVTTAAGVPGAVHGPAGGRHGRRDEHAAGAFDEVLGAPKTPHRAEASAGAKTRADPWRQAGTRLGTGAPALTAAIAKDGHAAKNTLDAKPERGVAESLDQADDTADDKADPAETGADDGLPTQMRAEQAISVIMSSAPMARQPAPPIGHGASKDDEAAGDAEATPPSGSKAGLATGAKLGPEQPSSSYTYKQVPGGPAAARHGTAPQPAVTDVPAQSAVTSGHPAKASGAAKAEEPKQAGPHAQPADPADPATEKSAAAVPGSARPGGSSDDADTRQGGSDGRNAAREFRRGEQLPAAGRVSVIAGQAAPAPAAPPLSANGAAIVNAVGAEQSWRAASNLSSALPGEAQNSTQPMRELKIQLHPLELGVVTAHLRTVGEKLSVELKVDNHDAYHRLSADSDAIVKSLRSLGFEIDSVSVQQPQAAATTVARADAGAGTGSFSRDTPSFQPGNSGSGGERLGGQASGRGEHGGGQGNDTAQPVHQDRAGSSLYI